MKTSCISLKFFVLFASINAMYLSQQRFIIRNLFKDTYLYDSVVYKIYVFTRASTFYKNNYVAWDSVCRLHVWQ